MFLYENCFHIRHQHHFATSNRNLLPGQQNIFIPNVRRNSGLCNSSVTPTPLILRYSSNATLLSIFHTPTRT
jgi:hypothetical protein